MKPQYQHELMTSFMLWFDHELLQKGEAYSNQTGALFYDNDSRLPSTYKAYASSYKQWVNDSSVVGDTNPIIPTGFNGSGRADHIIFDFENGRIIETGGAFNTGEVLTGTFAVKDFNIYLTNETEEDLILENKFKLNSRYSNIASGVKPYDQMAPAIFLNCEYMRNEGFAFGGEDLSTNTIKAVVLAENEYQLDGALSIFADSARKVIPKIPFTGHPGTEYGDVKNGTYFYTGVENAYGGSNPYYIDDVTVSKFSDRAQTKIPGDLKVGFIDFDISTTRFPRS
tara:strand:- start:65 stop:913 length:849 start_codon:yes stop_codon:yes gene_type:complete